MKILLLVLLNCFLGIVLLWSAGAFYFDVGRRGLTGWLCLIVWVISFITVLLLVKPIWLSIVVVLMAVGILACWWARLSPSHDRNWDPNFTKLPLFVLDGDLLTAKNVRNTTYRALTDYTALYETRTYHLSELQGVDVLILFWGSTAVSHPMVIFEFRDHQHLCVSIEVRYRQGGSYDMLGNLYRQNELMYVVSDERDAILRRTKYSENHDCFLYRLQSHPEQNLQLLTEYINETNSIYETPRWYNAITANCTTSIYHQRKGPKSWDLRILMNGKLDEMIYDWGMLYQGMPFKELKAKSWINDLANNADEATFSEEIRKGLVGQSISHAG